MRPTRSAARCAIWGRLRSRTEGADTLERVPARARPAILLAALSLTIGGIAVFTVKAATASSSAGLSRPTVVDLVHLLRHDQQGVSIADQAAAQAPDPGERALAATLAREHQTQADRLSALLGAHHVPATERYSVPVASSLPPQSNTTSPCDLASDDDLSRLANTPTATFDAAFAALVGRHVAGGAVLLDTLAAQDLPGSARVALAGDQARLAALVRS